MGVVFCERYAQSTRVIQFRLVESSLYGKIHDEIWCFITRDINLLRKLSIISSYRNTLYIRRIFRVTIRFLSQSKYCVEKFSYTHTRTTFERRAHETLLIVEHFALADARACDNTSGRMRECIIKMHIGVMQRKCILRIAQKHERTGLQRCDFRGL